jgi:hypothetical protein
MELVRSCAPRLLRFLAATAQELFLMEFVAG